MPIIVDKDDNSGSPEGTHCWKGNRCTMTVDNNIVDLTQCTEVLQELFSACNPNDSTCTNPNLQSFAVSTEQVCNAVNTPKKLLFEAIGDEFDGFVDKFAKCKLIYLGLDVLSVIDELSVLCDKCFLTICCVVQPSANL